MILMEVKSKFIKSNDTFNDWRCHSKRNSRCKNI